MFCFHRSFRVSVDIFATKGESDAAGLPTEVFKYALKVKVMAEPWAESAQSLCQFKHFASRCSKKHHGL